MLTIERRQAILEYMKQKNSVSVEELSRHFFISEATIRRDLEKMSEMGIIKRTYGGAVLITGLKSDVPLIMRENESTLAKEKIASCAVKLVKNGYTIFLDSSSTSMKLAPHFAKMAGVTVVTNSPKTALVLAQYKNIDVYCTGGKLRSKSLSFVGVTANNFCMNCNVDIAFISCQGLSAQRGATESCMEESEIKRQMIKLSKYSVLLCDSSKFNKVYFSYICSISDLNYLVTDSVKNDMFIKSISDSGIQVLCSE
jgi:DeoR/GlpR family transcriptional regulator of sugar metabolism